MSMACEDIDAGLPRGFAGSEVADVRDAGTIRSTEAGTIRSTERGKRCKSFDFILRIQENCNYETHNI
jgi:hypothetical protein